MRRRAGGGGVACRQEGAAGLEGPLQCLLLYHSPSSNINEDSPFWQQIQFDARDEAVGFVGSREAHNEDLGEGQ